MKQWDDARISLLFQEAKRRDKTSAPTFAHTLARARRESRGLVFLAPAGTLAAALILSAALLLQSGWKPPQSTRESEAASSLLQWESPTDFLLETTGHELRDSLPKLGLAHLPGTELPGKLAEPQGEKE